MRARLGPVPGQDCRAVVRLRCAIWHVLRVMQQSKGDSGGDNTILFTLLCSLGSFYQEAAMHMQPGVFAQCEGVL